MSTLIDALCERLNTKLDLHGRADAECPFCGHVVIRGTHHFYVYALRNGKTGYVCWSCGKRGKLHELAEYLEITEYEVSSESHTPNPARVWWKENPDKLLERVASKAVLDERVRLWQAYKPLTRGRIALYQLGVGRLPMYNEETGQWYFYRHPRLIVPAYRDGTLVAVRGRAYLPGDTGPKWLTASHSETTLYGINGVTKGATVVICENMADVLLAEQVESSIVAVCSTAGAGTWRSEWTEQLKMRQPKRILVWLDNDLAGCPNDKTYQSEIARWKAQMQERIRDGKIKQIPDPPKPAGPKIANLLLATGLRVSCYRWPKNTPPKADLGYALTQYLSE